MTKCKTTNYLIFTDLDATLLDHKTYSFEKAREMLNYINTEKIPLIIVTSKTKEELLELQTKLQIKSPFIVENGAGIFLPRNSCFEQINMGKTYKETLTFFNKHKEEYLLRGFFDMDVNEIEKLTNLDKKNASQAKKRDFCEPFIIENEAKIDDFKKLCIEEGFDVVKGGRFYHLISFGQDKANAVLEVKEIYETRFEKEYKTIALGDGENDITMLDSVDIPVLIKKHDGSFIDFNKKNLIKTDKIGPEGWNEALKGILCK